MRVALRAGEAEVIGETRLVEEIGDKTDAGTCCGCCISDEKDFGEEKMELYLTTILEKFKK